MFFRITTDFHYVMQPLPLLVQRSSLSDADVTASVVDRVVELARRLGLAVEAVPPDVDALDNNRGRRAAVVREGANGMGLCYLILTGGSEGPTLEEVRDSGALSVGLISHPELNSLPAALEIAAYLPQMGVGVRLVHLSRAALDGEQGAALDDLVGLVKAFEARHLLSTTRLGVIGDPSPWLLTSRKLDDARIRRDWGVELVRIGLEELQDEIERTPAEAANAIADEIIRNAEPPSVVELENAANVSESGCGMTGGCRCCGSHGVVPEHVVKAARVFKALEVVTERARLTAFTIRCFDLLERPVVAGCLAVSLMNDRGMIAGCEGDVHAAITMLLAKVFVQRPSFLANPVDVDVATGRVLLCHCTVARSICESYSLDSHFESGLSVSVAGKIVADGPVTVARVDATRNLVFAAEGTVDPRHLKQENQCRTQVLVVLDPSDAQSILHHPLGNHHVLIFGACASAFKAFAELFVRRVGAL